MTSNTDENYVKGCLKPARAWVEAQREAWWREVIAARVRVGALYCDNNVKPYKGHAWFSRVQLGILDMGNCGMCIMGQLFGEWEDSPMMLHPQCRSMGFECWEYKGDWDRALENTDAEFYYSAPGRDEEYALLGWAWRNEIKARRNAARIIPDGFTESLGLHS